MSEGWAGHSGPSEQWEDRCDDAERAGFATAPETVTIPKADLVEIRDALVLNRLSYPAGTAARDNLETALTKLEGYLNGKG